MRRYTVYMHISPSNKKYIGITCQKPERRWQNGRGYRWNQYFHRAIEKYGWDNFQHIIIARGLDKEEAKWLEMELIKEFDTTDKYKGYNITIGGEGANGAIRSEETRKKLSEARKGISLTEEAKSKLSKANSGENHPLFGTHRTEETRKKISEANSGENHWGIRKIILLNTREIFSFIKEGAEKYNVDQSSISKCCNGKQKSSGKLEDGTPLVWMYYEEYLNITEEEVQEKLSEADNRIICITTNEVFLMAKEGAEFYKTSRSGISQCCHGTRKSSGRLEDGTPLVWKLLKDYLAEQNN